MASLSAPAWPWAAAPSAGVKVSRVAGQVRWCISSRGCVVPTLSAPKKMSSPASQTSVGQRICSASPSRRW